MIEITRQQKGSPLCNVILASLADKKPWMVSFAETAKLDLNSTHAEEFNVPYFPYPIWRDEAMHNLVMHVAKNAAEAIAKSGRPIRMAEHVMLRVDIALTHEDRVVSQHSACVLSCDVMHAFSYATSRQHSTSPKSVQD